MTSSENFSCITRVNKIMHVALPPSYIGNKVAGVLDILEGMKSEYVKILEGILVDVKNVSFVNPLGTIITDQPFIHYDVRADFYVFKPSVGSILKGTINRISRDHIGCVVHDSINVSIHLSENIASNVAKFICLDKNILFQVTSVDVQRRVIRVKGKITSDCIELMEKNVDFKS